VHVAVYAQGIHSGQEAKRQKDKDQTQASGEEKNKPKRMPEHLNLMAYVPGIAT
jgi:hypothetical protein